jgi:hypothetical protein
VRDDRASPVEKHPVTLDLVVSRACPDVWVRGIRAEQTRVRAHEIGERVQARFES